MVAAQATRDRDDFDDAAATPFIEQRVTLVVMWRSARSVITNEQLKLTEAQEINASCRAHEISLTTMISFSSTVTTMIPAWVDLCDLVDDFSVQEDGHVWLHGSKHARSSTLRSHDASLLHSMSRVVGLSGV